MSEKAQIIIGVDPGTLVTGYGIISLDASSSIALDFGCIRPPQNLKLTDRYLIIYNGLEELLKRFAPSVMVIETQFVGKNAQSAIKLGMARGIAILAAKRAGLTVFEYPPARAKQAVVGNGRASKIQVQHMVKTLLGLDMLPSPEDAADALAMALCHAHTCRFKSPSEAEI
jgi:crossover junction endodeoxyribonuclease RuvC